MTRKNLRFNWINKLMNRGCLDRIRVCFEHGLETFDIAPPTGLEPLESRLLLSGTLYGSNIDFNLTTGIVIDTIGSTASPIGPDSNQLGNDGFESVVGMAYDPNTDTLYGVDIDLGQLLTIDPVTGAGAGIGLPGQLLDDGFFDVFSLAFDPNTDTLYAVDIDLDQLLTIDPVTGEATGIGSPGDLFFEDVHGLAFDPNTNTLYGVDNNDGQILTIDTGTGEGFGIGDAFQLYDDGFFDVYGLTFDPTTDTLYGVDPIVGQLITLDTVTGEATGVGNPLELITSGFSDVEALAFASAPAGTEYLIDTLADSTTFDGKVSLREAILASSNNIPIADAPAGSAVGVDTVLFDMAALSAEAGVPLGQPVTITLNGSELQIFDTLSIHGPGQDQLTIDANGMSRVFTTFGTQENTGVTVLINDVTITGGSTTDSGGAIGNGIDLRLIDVSVTDSSAANNGGGIQNQSRLTLIRSTISGNSAVDGGGIINSGTLEVIDSTITGNKAQGDFSDGGGIFNGSGVVRMVNTTVSGNTARFAGGISHLSGFMFLTNTAIVGNAAEIGGGMQGSAGTVEINNSTITGNSASATGGGIVNEAASTTTLNNSIVSLNVAPNSADIHGVFNTSHDLIGVDPLFVRNASPGSDGIRGTPDDDFGDLRLQLLSPGLNTGDNTLLPFDEFDLDSDNITFEPLPVDQRGGQRVVDGTVDIGALEGFVTQFTVTSLGDDVVSDGKVTLREAIEAANTNAAPTTDVGPGSTNSTDVIFFDLVALSNEAGVNVGEPLRIELTGSELEVIGDLQIVGLGRDLLTVDANDLSRVFHVSQSDVLVELIAMTLTGGSSPTDGGGIGNRGTLTLRSTTITGNSATTLGGGIVNFGTTHLIDSAVSGNTSLGSSGAIENFGTLTITDSTISGNMALGEFGIGGAIINGGTATLTIDNSTISGNSANSRGGGIYNFNNVTLNNSTISGNSVTDSGGGIYNEGSVTLNQSTVSGNTATDADTPSFGGGVSNVGTLTVTNTTITGNTATSDNQFGSGGGIFNANSGTVTLTHSTITGNTTRGPDASGGGIYNISTGLVALTNSVLSGNAASATGPGGVGVGGGIFNSNGPVTLNNSTLAGNEALGNTAQGGGINSSSSLTLNNTIVTLNTATTGPDVSGAFIDNTNLVGVDPIFLRNPFAGLDGDWGTSDDDYGDLRLGPGSSGIDTGVNAHLTTDVFDLDGDGDTSEAVPFDRAGNTRLVDGTVDIGAFEHQGTALIGDFNNDSLVDADDVELLSQAINSNSQDLRFDLSGDGSVNAPDGLFLIEDILNTFPADFNLDYQVDVSDLSTWATGFGSGTLHRRGDSNFDGQVDVTDLSNWATQFGRTSSPPPLLAPLSTHAVADDATDSGAPSTETGDRALLLVTGHTDDGLNAPTTSFSQRGRWDNITSLLDHQQSDPNKRVNTVLEVMRGVARLI